MSEFKGTPGPWSATNDRVFSTYGQRSGDGHVLPESEKWVIADLIGSGSYGGFEIVELGDDDREANAKLIAAAPDLLEALIESRQVIATALQVGASDWFDSDEKIAQHTTVKKIDAAIAKATA